MEYNTQAYEKTDSIITPNGCQLEGQAWRPTVDAAVAAEVAPLRRMTMLPLGVSVQMVHERSNNE